MSAIAPSSSPVERGRTSDTQPEHGTLQYSYVRFDSNSSRQCCLGIEIIQDERLRLLMKRYRPLWPDRRTWRCRFGAFDRWRDVSEYRQKALNKGKVKEKVDRLSLDDGG